MPYAYFTQQGYKVLVDDKWMLFASESDYYDYIQEED
jgi:hypothetical protein